MQGVAGNCWELPRVAGSCREWPGIAGNRWEFLGIAGNCRELPGIAAGMHQAWLDCLISAIEREKRLKKWNRAWKLRLIEKKNPEWRDLYPEICE